MNIEQLSYLAEVAHSKSLVKASSRLHVTESAISQAITRLEAELDVVIFERTRTGFVPTRKGKAIIDKAIIALEAINQIKMVANNKATNQNEHLRISTITELTAHINDIYYNYDKGTFPNIEVIEQSSKETIEDIEKGLVDIGFIVFNKKKLNLLKEFEFTPILKGKFVIATTQDYHLHEMERIAFEPFKNEKFVLYKDSDIQEIIDVLQSLFGPINVMFKTKNINLINHAVQNYGALTIGHNLYSIFDKSLVYKEDFKVIDLGKYIDTSFQFGWIKRKGHQLSHEASYFIEKINEVLLEDQKLVIKK